MKRSKIFLAATTSLLAVVGFISAKAVKTFGPITYYTSAHNCTRGLSGAAHTGVPHTSAIGFTQFGAHSSGCNGAVVYSAE